MDQSKEDRSCGAGNLARFGNDGRDAGDEDDSRKSAVTENINKNAPESFMEFRSIEFFCERIRLRNTHFRSGN